METQKTIAYKGYNVPTGTTLKDKNERIKIIKNFYNSWVGENGERNLAICWLWNVLFRNFVRT